MALKLKLKKSAIEKLDQKDQQGTRHKILVVDDEEANLRALIDTLENDYDILTATNGQEALDLINSSLSNIDKLLVALMMGTHSLGFYAIASMLMGPLMNIPGASREVTEQVLMAAHSKMTTHQQLHEHLFKSLRYTAYLMPLLIAGFYFGIPLIIAAVLPD